MSDKDGEAAWIEGLDVDEEATVRDGGSWLLIGYIAAALSGIVMCHTTWVFYRNTASSIRIYRYSLILGIVASILWILFGCANRLGPTITYATVATICLSFILYLSWKRRSLPHHSSLS